MIETQTFRLPIPPSVNQYWRQVGKGRAILSDRARRWRNEAISTIQQGWVEPVGKWPCSVHVVLNPSTRRSFDVDNFNKGLLDAFTKAGFWEDDNQVIRLTCIKRTLLPETMFPRKHRADYLRLAKANAGAFISVSLEVPDTAEMQEARAAWIIRQIAEAKRSGGDDHLPCLPHIYA